GNVSSDVSTLTISSVGSAEPQTIAEGNYTLKLIASFGDYKKIKTTDINVDTTKPAITLTRDPPGISPNGDGVRDTMQINYSLSDNLSPTCEVKLSLLKNGRILNILIDGNRTLEERTGTSPVPTFGSIAWDGKIGGNIIEGAYLLSLEATDLAGNTSITFEAVLVDFQPPRIEAVKLSNPYFSPNNDGRKDNTEIKFNLYDTYSDKMFVTIQIENDQGGLATKLIERQELTNGEHVVTWEGTTPLLLGEGTGVRALEDGTYSLRIYAEDTTGNLGTCEPQAVVVDTVPPTIESLIADPNPFTPNDDKIKDTTSFKFKLSEPCLAELQVFRDDGALFWQRDMNNITEKSVAWDGKGSRGELLGGTYTYTLYAEDRAANITTSEAKTIVVDREPSLIPYAFADPDPFSAARGDATGIRYYVSRDNVTVEASVVGNDGAVIKSLIRNEVKNKGEHTVLWRGDYAPGYDGPHSTRDKNKVPDGMYEFKITAYDPYNAVSGDNSNTVLVDNTPPYLSVDPVTVDQHSKTATLTYFLPEHSSVEVSVFDQSGALIAGLVSREAEMAGEHSLQYKIPADDLQLRYFKLTADDAAKNRDEKTTELFSITASNELMVTKLSAAPNPFTPNGDGHMDSTTLRYSISGGVEPYKTSVTIVSAAGSTIKRLVEDEEQTSGIWSFTWMPGNLDALIPDGSYEYVITATDKLGSKVESRGSLVVILTRPTVAISTNIPIFSPNSDASKDTVLFNYSIDYPMAYITGEALVKIEVLNTSSEAVWSKVFNHTAGNYSYTWDGTPLPLGEGRGVRAGNYYVKISAEDALGQTAVQKSVPLTVDYTKPVVSIVELAPNPFSPQPNGIRDETAIAYTLSKPADTTIQVKNAAGETVKTLLSAQRIQSSGVKASTVPTIIWDGKNESGEIIPDGSYTIAVSALDDAGNTGEASSLAEVDNNTEYSDALPPIRNVEVKPAYAKLASKVTVDFSVSETLLTDPIVNVGTGLVPVHATKEASEKITDSRYDYHYSHIVSGDQEGQTRVYIETVDLAGNVSSYESTFVVDKTTPEIGAITVSRNPANVGTVNIDFPVTDINGLKAIPTVEVTLNGVKANCPVSLLSGNNYRGIYTVQAGTNGTAEIMIKVNDAALNYNSATATFVVDTTVPTFSQVRSSVVGNAENPLYAREGATVLITFEASEQLKFDPVVKIKSGTATFSRRFPTDSDSNYEYQYIVLPTDINGQAEIMVSGYDIAGNYGEYATALPSESFIIDRQNPTVAIAYPGSAEIIASPSPFFTNADPTDTAERPNYTTLRYETSEHGLVTLKAYKVDKTKTADQYTRDDFTGTPVATLVDGSWMDGGVKNYIWQGKTTVAQYDSDGDSYADPGKYAFIVEVKDRAGNVTERLWGGTVWIQNNVLQIEQPETVGINPDPLNFSSNGNSTIEATKFWFKVKLGVSPASPRDPEHIEIMAVADDFKWLEGVVKKVGKYTVRVYAASGVLVRTIEQDTEVLSSTDTFVNWDGKNDAGSYAPDGDYRITVEIKDFAGNLASCIEGGTSLSRSVKVDSTPPTITDNQSGDDTWRNTAGTVYNVDLSDDGSKLQDAYYKVRKPNGVETAWQPLTVTSGSAAFTTDWSVDFSNDYCQEGTNYVSVKVMDIAGNETIKNDAFYVKKDTVVPINSGNPIVISNTYDGSVTYTNRTGVSLALSGVDQNEPHCSHVTKMKLWNDGESEPLSSIAYSTLASWNIRDAEGNRTVYVKFGDEAGNWSSTHGSTIAYDKTVPYITSISDATDPISPGNRDGSYDASAISFSLSETCNVALRINGAVQNLGTLSSGRYTWDPQTSVSDGSYPYALRLVDVVGNDSGWLDGGTITVDNTAPPAPMRESATSASGVANLVWNTVNGANGYYIYRAATYNGTYSKVGGLCTTTSYQDTGLSNGSRYWYKIASVDSVGNEALSGYIAVAPGILDNTKIIFTLYDGDNEVYKMNVDGSSQIKITANSDSDENPSFSPDGTKIVFVSRRDGNCEIYKMNIDGTNQERLTNNSIADCFPSFSPDNLKITFSSCRDGNDDVYVMNADGSNQVRLTNNAATDGISSFSPDGTKIIFSSSRDGNYEIYMMNADGSSQINLTNNAAVDTFPSFSPDGTEIVFISTRDGNYY
ncbi:MAG: FlgD immunoglobulin-like domain containing protein, partial [Candidatus Margulisiibacteriota bacterium]